MSDPRMIPADDAQITLDAINHTGGHGFSFHDTYTRDLAYTVERQAAQIERVRAVLTDLRGQQEDASRRWDDTSDTWDGATSDTLHDTINLLAEALGGTDEDH